MAPAPIKALVTPSVAIIAEPNNGPIMELALPLICSIALACVISSSLTREGMMARDAGLKNADAREIPIVPIINNLVSNMLI